MNDSKTLFAEFVQSNPHPDQLSEDRLRSVLADIFKGDRDRQEIVSSLIKTGKLFSLPMSNVEALASSYALVLNIDREIAFDSISMCLAVVQEQMKQSPSNQVTQKTKITLKNLSWDSAPVDVAPTKGDYLKARDYNGKKEQLDAHPQIPYPKYTLKDDIDDYGGKLYEELFRPLLCAVIGFGIPTYLIVLLLNYLGKENWNVYAWCLYGIICLCVLCKGISDFFQYKSSLANPRNEDCYHFNHLTKYIQKKGYAARAEKIMKNVYNEARANKDRYDMKRLCEMIERAYQDALEDVLCYFNDEERWAYLEANEAFRKGGAGDLSVYGDLYMRYYNDTENHREPFNIAKYAVNIWGDKYGRPDI